MTKTRLIIPVTIGLAVVALTLAFNRPKDTSALASTSGSAPLSATAFSISSISVSRQSMLEQISAVGTVMPWQELCLSAQTGGLAVMEVMVGENDPVSKGDLLARLDDRVLNAQIAQQKALIDEAQANLVSAIQKLERGNKLLVTQAVSNQSVDDQKTSVTVSQAKLNQSKAILDQLEAQLAQTRITAPVDGYVSQKPIVVGSAVQLGTELVRIIRGGRLEIEAKIPEKNMATMSGGQLARFAESNGVETETPVRAAAAKVDAKTRLGLIYVTVPATSRLKPGMFVQVNIDVKSHDVLAVPEQALVWRDGRPGVFVLNGESRAILKEVTTGLRKAGLVAIESGVKEGDRIALSGAGFLNDGDKVQASLAEAGIDQDERPR